MVSNPIEIKHICGNVQLSSSLTPTAPHGSAIIVMPKSLLSVHMRNLDEGCYDALAALAAPWKFIDFLVHVSVAFL